MRITGVFGLLRDRLERTGLLEWGPMPWCGSCDRFLSPSTVTVDGRCPRCGSTVDPGRAQAPQANRSSAEPPLADVGPRNPGPGGEAEHGDSDEEKVPLPWHFKLLVAALVFYLGWRAFQGVEWLSGRF